MTLALSYLSFLFPGVPMSDDLSARRAANQLRGDLTETVVRLERGDTIEDLNREGRERLEREKGERK